MNRTNFKPFEVGLDQAKIDEICERLYQEELKYSNSPCHDCGVDPNHVHGEDCDVARCSECYGQLLSCDCVNGKPDIWTGLWPGIKECYEQKLICFKVSNNERKWSFDLNLWNENRINSKQKTSQP